MFNGIKIGSTVQDALTGFVGTVSSKLESLSGMVQFGVQPACKTGDTALPEALFMDWQSLKVIGRDHEKLPTAAGKSTVKLGARVRDSVSGFVGIATTRMTFFNGCVQYTVVSAVDKDNKPRDMQLPSNRVIVVDAGLNAPEPKPGTGGPITKAMRPV